MDKFEGWIYDTFEELVKDVIYRLIGGDVKSYMVEDPVTVTLEDGRVYAIKVRTGNRGRIHVCDVSKV